MNWKRLLILIAAFILYLIIGGLVFSALESSKEENSRVDIRKYKAALLDELPCLNESRLEELIAVVVNAVERGLSPTNNITSKSNWDFSSSFFFSGTVVTTIGYGNISPSTRNGQTFCIFYALIGIPVVGIILVAIGEKLKTQANHLEKKLNKRFVEHPRIKTAVYSGILLATGVLFFMIIPAVIISRIEQWEFSDAFYYTFITLSTIGFGDFVIGTNPDIDYHILYKWCAYAWIIIGLAFLALVISFISEIFTMTADNIGKTDKKKRGMEETGGMENAQGVQDKETKGDGLEKNDGHNEEMKELQKENSVGSSA